NGPEFDENANLTRLALHAQGAPLILSNSNRYHHGHHRNHKSSSAATHQATGSGVGSAKAVTIGSSQIQQESSTNCSARSSAIQLPQHPGLGCNVGQRRSHDAHPTIVGAGGQSGGGVIKSYEAAASLELIPANGNTSNSSASTVMSGSAMSSSVSSSSSSSTSSTSSTTSSASTEMCLPRIIKPRKRRKKDRKPNVSQGTTAGGTNGGGVPSTGNGTDAGMCSASDGASSGSAAGSLPCLEPHLLNVGGGSSVHTMNNILLQHQQSSSLHCVPPSMEPRNVGFAELASAPVSNPSPSSVSLTEPASPSASSNCSCRLCDPFGRIWAFPMLRHSSCSSADGFETEGRKKNVGVIGSNRNSGAALRGTWCTSTESTPFATLNIGENADGCVSRKGSFSDSGSDSGCDLLLSRLPGLCSTEEEEEEDDDEEEENEEQGDCVGEESDSLLSSVQNDEAFAGRYSDLPWLDAIVGHRVDGLSGGASSCTRKAKDDELLLMSELTKKLHETLDLVDESGLGHESSRSKKEGAGVMAPRSGSCSSSSSSTSDNSSGMGSLIGADSSSLSPPTDAFVGFDAMSRSNLFGGKGTSIGQRLLMGGDRLFDSGVECLVMDESDVRASEMLKSSATNAYQMVSFKRSLSSSKCEQGIEGGVVSVTNGGCATEGGDDVSLESNVVQCEKRNPLSLRPISVVGSLYSVNQHNSAPTGSSSWISSTGTGAGGNSRLFGGEQQSQQFPDQHQPHRQPSTDGGLGDMLNCFDTFWSGSDHKQLLLTEK
uniref:Uncharacterized protein n=1 Tax=Anopheles maculatus TaxID=74869 RepID=A0A182ST10_9DIPT